MCVSVLSVNCPNDKAPVNCLVNPCKHQSCGNYPEAVCTVNVCGQCSAQFYVNGTDVTNYCGKNNCIRHIIKCYRCDLPC